MFLRSLFCLPDYTALHKVKTISKERAELADASFYAAFAGSCSEGFLAGIEYRKERLKTLFGGKE
jgi:hypothetical protein